MSEVKRATALAGTVGCGVVPIAALGWATLLAWDELAVALLGARRVVVRAGSDLQVRVAIGPLSLPLWHVPLADISGVEAREGAAEGCSALLVLAGGRTRFLARGLSMTSARRIEAVVAGWRGCGAMIPSPGTRTAEGKPVDPIRDDLVK